MMKEIFEIRYNRKNYLDFLQNNILPDDFKIYTENIELPRTYRFLKEMYIIGECESIDTIIVEALIDSKKNPYYMAMKEIIGIIKNYLFKNMIIFSIPLNNEHYRMSYITSDLILSKKKVSEIYNITKTKSLYLGTDFSKIDKEDFYEPLLRDSKISNINELDNWFLISRRKTYFKPSTYYYDFLKWRIKEKENKINSVSSLHCPVTENPFFERYNNLSLDDDIHVNDEVLDLVNSSDVDSPPTWLSQKINDNIFAYKYRQIISKYDNSNPSNVEYDSQYEFKSTQDLYIISAYNGFEFFIEKRYEEAILEINKALSYYDGDFSLLHSILAKCFYYINDNDNFLESVFLVFRDGYVYIDYEFEEIIQQYIKENRITDIIEG